MATSGNKQQRSSLNGSVQASDLRENPSHVINGVTVMVGENREHFSLLHGNRRQRHQQYYDRAVRAVPSVVAGSEPTSGNEDEEVQNDSEGLLMLNLKVLVKNRMSGYRHLMCSRRPKGKGVLLVLTIVLLESFAFIGALTGIRRLLPVNDCHKCRTDWESFMLSLLSSSVGRVFYPIAGVIADSYLGRYSVIHIGLWLLWIGFAVSAFSLGVQLLIPAGSVAGKVCECVVAVIAVVLFGAGSGSVEATLIPFGVDQLAQGAPSDELSSYFHYYYIARNIGGLIATLVLFVVFDEISFFPHPVDSPTSKASKFNVEIKYILQNLLAILAVTLALLIVLYCRKQFYRDKQHSNALKSVTRVSCYAARVKRQLPQRNRAFRYGGALTPRIDLAKEENDGTFSGEEVEEVKTFYRMLLLILSLFGYFITYGAVSICSMYGYTVKGCNR